MSNSTGLAVTERLEVHEEEPLPRPQQIARMRFTVQQLLAQTVSNDRGAQSTQRAGEEFPVSVRKLWSLLSFGQRSLRVGDSIGEVWCCHIDLAQAGMKSGECVRIFRRRYHGGCLRLVVGPQGDREAAAHVDTRLHPRFKFSHRAIGLCEAPRNLDLELRAAVMRSRRDAREHVTRGQAHGDAIRVVHYARPYQRRPDPRLRARPAGYERAAADHPCLFVSTLTAPAAPPPHGTELPVCCAVPALN
jgi:hypothetical protein